MKAVVIFSGGQDSTTCLYWALKRYDEVFAITFSYGQKHSVEIEQSRKICLMANVRQLTINMDFLNQVADSALLDGGDVNEVKENGLPASFVPNRNQLFITLAHAFAQKVGAKVLITGVCQTDYSGYPDCRQEFVDSVYRTSKLGSGADIPILTPLMNLTKAQTFKLAEEEGCLKEVIEHSHTCYNGQRNKRYAWGLGCGHCPACKLREKGWIDYKLINH